MRKVYFIHENTKPISIKDNFLKNGTTLKSNHYIQIATDYVCAVGYINTEDENDPNCDSAYETIYDHDGPDDYPNIELTNFIPGLLFETYEEGCKVLAKILSARTENDAKILETFKTLSEKYPEALI